MEKENDTLRLKVPSDNSEHLCEICGIRLDNTSAGPCCSVQCARLRARFYNNISLDLVLRSVEDALANARDKVNDLVEDLYGKGPIRFIMPDPAARQYSAETEAPAISDSIAVSPGDEVVRP